MGIINWQKELLPFEQAVDELIVKFNGIKRDYMRLDKQCPIEQVEGRVKKFLVYLKKLIEEIYLLIKLLINWKI